MDTNNCETKYKPSKKFRTIIFVLIGIALLGLGYLYNNTLIFSDTIEDERISFKVPGAYKSDEVGQYYNDSTMMQTSIYYIRNDYELTLDEMLQLESALWFTEDDVIDTYPAIINGKDTRQIRYKDLQMSENGLQYYYSGIMMIMELENEYLLMDVYCAMDESTGEKRDIKESELKLITDIINSVEVKNYAVTNTKNTTEHNINGLNVTLRNDWKGGQYTQIDYGHAEYFESPELPLRFDCIVYNDQNKVDLTIVKTSMVQQLTYGNYTFLGQETLAGEPCLVYSYYGLDDDYNFFSSGVYAISESYSLDMFFYSYDDDYVLSDKTIKIFKDFILSVQ